MLTAATLALQACAGPPAPAATAAEVAGIERHTLDEGRVKLSYLRAGDPHGRLVLLIHGTPGSAEGWADFLLHPPAGVDYVAVDRPGFGRTGPDAAEPSLARQAAALIPLLKAGVARRPILVGHSYGAPVAARIAADRPDLVAGLVLAAGALDPAQEHVYAIQRAGEWPMLRSLLPTAMRNANRELIPLGGELRALAPALDRITSPVVVVHGTADRNVPYANVAYMRSRLRHARRLEVVTLVGANHFLPWRHRTTLEAAIHEVMR